jgi:protoporphyrin/coproporphyrin ferrochelatase
MTQAAVLLVSHGTVDDLDDLAAFVTNVRLGRPPTAEMVAELRHRYEAIGGRSPLNATTAEVARKLQGVLGVRVAWANRLWRPAVRDVLAELAAAGAGRVAVLPLAPFSTHVYEEDARRAADGLGVELACTPAWGSVAGLIDAFAARIAAVLPPGGAPPDPPMLLLTAHSLPQSVIDAGDPYARQVRAAAEAVVADVRRRTSLAVPWTLAFQSQGLATPGVAWLGPDLGTALDQAREHGVRSIVACAIGFLGDHVETLYDLDVEAAALARQRGLSFTRAASLNAADDLVEVLAGLARPLLDHG